MQVVADGDGVAEPLRQLDQLDIATDTAALRSRSSNDRARLNFDLARSTSSP
jgi:hypothetical protein